MPWQSLSAQAARALLEEAGFAVAAADLRVEAREERWAVRLPGDRLPAVVADPPLVARADAVMEAYESIPVSEGDRVLVHGDLGPHNLAVDPKSFALRGVFDYSAAAWADRHHDFRYLLLVPGREDLLEAAREAIERALPEVDAAVAGD